jgi:hypothetical protein
MAVLKNLAQVTPDAVTPLSAATVDKVLVAFVSAPAANTGNIFIGGPTVSSTTGTEIVKGTTLRIDAPGADEHLDLQLMFVKNVTAGDDVQISYLQKVN